MIQFRLDFSSFIANSNVFTRCTKKWFYQQRKSSNWDSITALEYIQQDIILSKGGFSSLTVRLCNNYLHTYKHHTSCIEHGIYTWNDNKQFSCRTFWVLIHVMAFNVQLLSCFFCQKQGRVFGRYIILRCTFNSILVR